MKGPVLEFKSNDEARRALKEWQHRLYLDDWIIEVRMVDPTELDEECGTMNFNLVHKSAVIRIARLNDDVKSRIVRVSNEKTLVHELLHLKYNWVARDDSYEGKYVDVCEHANLEQMARSLIMAKYDIGPEWFDNTDWSE